VLQSITSHSLGNAVRTMSEWSELLMGSCKAFFLQMQPDFVANLVLCGTPVGEEKLFLCSFMTVSICCYCCIEEPFTGVMDVATIFPLLWERIKQKINFLICEMSVLHFLAVIKEVVVGGATSGILYNELPKEIITVRGLDSYIACHLHKYGWHNNTSETSRGVTSHNTSFVKGLML